MPTVTITLKDGASPYDITGASVESIARGVSKGNTGVLTLDAQIADAPNGVITLDLLPAGSEDAPIGKYKWDVIVTLSDGTVLPPVQTGIIMLGKTVTLD